MNNAKRQFIPDEFDDLLLKTIIKDFNTNIEIQNIVEMKMNYIQSLPIENAISLSFDKKYKNAFNVNPFGNVFWSKILFFVLSMALINSFFTTPNNLQSSDKQSSSIIFVKDTIQNIQIDYDEHPEIINPKAATIIMDSIHTIIHKNDSSKNLFPNNWGGQSVGYQSKNSVRTEVFDEEFAIAISPINDNVKIQTAYYNINGYKTILYGSKFAKSATKDTSLSRKIKPNYQILPFYEGIPFKKQFDNFTLISITPQLEKPSARLNEVVISTRFPQAINLYFDEESPDFNPNKLMQNNDNLQFLAPFYISNYEISNLDYREFLAWVGRYNGLDYIKLTSDSLEYFSKYYTYTFHSENQEILKRFGTNVINVMPKADVWETDFPNSYNQPMTTHYLAHPAYKHYPVVGVTYWQALAYLDWLTWIWQSRIDAQGIPYEIKYDLPTAYEWEQSANFTLNQHAMDFPLLNGLCNLLVEKTDDIEFRRAMGLMHSNHFDQVMEAFHTAPVMSPTPSNPPLTSGILNMSGNVSEWLKEDYQQNWLGYYSRRKAELAKSEKPSSKLFLATMDYFDETCNHPQGKMVMGSNWYDRRWTDRAITLANGMSVKAFVNPDEAHSTIGFRPVIRVRLKNEKVIIQTICTLGRVLPDIDYSLMKQKNTNDLTSFAFVPMGSFKSKGKTVSVQAFYAMKTEVSNFAWMLFLNDLLKTGEMVKLQECIPDDADWTLKMSYESGMYKDWKLADRWDYLPFSKKFINDNKLKEIPLTAFAFEPIVGISKQAMLYFAQWMSEKSGLGIDFRLPMEAEIEWMSLGGLPSDSMLYPWQGKFMRDYRGVFLARYHSHMSDFGKGAKPNLPLDSTYFNQRKTLFATDSNWTNPNGPFIIATFKPNGYGIYDLAGNAAEAVYETGFTKGGSWGSTSAFLQIKQREYWASQSSDCVGFRLVMTYLGKK